MKTVIEIIEGIEFRLKELRKQQKVLLENWDETPFSDSFGYANRIDELETLLTTIKQELKKGLDS